MSRILVATAVAALVAGFVLGSPDSAEGRDTPAVQATPAGNAGSSSRLSMESCPCKDQLLNWQPPFKCGRAPQGHGRRAHGLFAARNAARPWWWTAVWSK
jgi:hypothetical protein